MYLPLPRKPKTGAPAWTITFADLMALLTTFFVLLLSFSELDVRKYRQMVYSMSEGFRGSWRQASEPLTPTVGSTILVQPISQLPSGEVIPLALPQAIDPALFELLKHFSQALDPEVNGGLLDVQHNDRGEVVISFRHESAFESGSEVLISDFVRTIDKIAGLLSHTQGLVIIAGHTDDLPIHTEQFRSNWDLSTARAVSVVHRLLEHPGMRAERLVAEGYAATQPVVANTTPLNRARNRRVEIRVRPIVPNQDESKP